MKISIFGLSAIFQSVNSLSSIFRKYFYILFIVSNILTLCIVILELVDFFVRTILLNL